MSYCRWSSDDHQCDVYVYDDVHGGITTHVAGKRRVFADALPPPIPFDKEHLNEWLERHHKVNDMLDRSELVAIGLPHDGESFNDPDAASAADRLESLRTIGYSVPQYAIDALREDSKKGTR